jgi:hypothetical protein
MGVGGTMLRNDRDTSSSIVDLSKYLADIELIEYIDRQRSLN